MASLPLNLGVGLTTDGSLLSSPGAAVSSDLRQQIFKRDSYSCAYCGFKSSRFQDIRPADPSRPVNPKRAEDWVTVCHMCEQCLSLERVGLMGEGLLIWLPEIEQKNLNHIVRALYIAKTHEGPLADAAKRGVDALKARRDEAKRRLGTDDASVLAADFIDILSESDYAARSEKLEGIRLLSIDRRVQRTPNGEVDRFPDMVAFWKSKDGPFSEAPLENWISLAQKLDGNAPA